MEEKYNCEEFEGEIEVSGDSENYFSDENDTATFAPEELLDNSTSLAGTLTHWLWYWKRIIY